MLSSLWTLQAASGGPEKTLAEWGFSGASLTSTHQAPDVLTLSLPLADAIAPDDLWTWETELILRRDGAVYYRGYVASSPRSLSPSDESASYELRSHWWLLERLTYRQNWTGLTGSTLGPVTTGRVSLARDEAVPTAAAMFAELAAFCASLGVTVTIDTDDLSDQALPLIEGHNRTVAELIRDILRWFPGVTLVPIYDEDGTGYRILTPDSDETATIAIAGTPLADLQVAALPEQQVDAVQIIYETTARVASYDDGSEETIGGFTASNALVAATDTYPVDATLTRRSLVLTLPHPQLPPDPVPQYLRQPVVTETYPEDGASDTAAERWWLDRSGLGALGLTTADIVLASTSTATVMAHRVILDPAVPAEYPPSPINPESVPVWAPDVVGDVPRRLVGGSLADWMRVKAAPLIAKVTMGVRKSAVDGLSTVNKAAFHRMGFRSGEVSGTDAWIKDADYRFTGTDAVTKTYVKLVSVDYGDVDSEERAEEVTEESYLGAISSAVVPGLAERLFRELSVLRYEGTCSLTTEEVPATAYLGRRLRFTHADRPEWGTMEALIQSVSADLDSGRVSLRFGPPQHLSPQDWVALHEAARTMRERHIASASSVQTDEEEDSPTSAQIGTTITRNDFFSYPESAATVRQMWDLVPIEGGGGTFECYAPRIISPVRSTVSATDLAITGNSFVPAADNWVFVRMDFTGLAVIEMAASWTGHPQWYQWTGLELTYARIPLWKLVGEEEAGAVAISDGVWGLRYVGTGALRSLRTTAIVPGENKLATVIDLF